MIEQQPAPSPTAFFNVDQIPELLGLSRREVRQLISRGEIKTQSGRNRKPRVVHVDDLCAYVTGSAATEAQQERLLAQESIGKAALYQAEANRYAEACISVKRLREMESLVGKTFDEGMSVEESRSKFRVVWRRWAEGSQAGDEDGPQDLHETLDDLGISTPAHLQSLVRTVALAAILAECHFRLAGTQADDEDLVDLRYVAGVLGEPNSLMAW